MAEAEDFASLYRSADNRNCGWMLAVARSGDWPQNLKCEVGRPVIEVNALVILAYKVYE